MLKEPRELVYKYIGVILKQKKCQQYILYGVEDHLHIITNLHPTIAIASHVKEIKVSSHDFIKEKSLITNFPGWQIGYGAFTYANEALPNLIRYVQNQEIHHGEITFEDEYISLLEEHRVVYGPRYVFD